MSVLTNRKLGFIGAGNMSQAIIGALIETKSLSPEQIWASNRSEGKLTRLKNDFGINTARNNEELIEACDVVILAVKPQDLVAAVEPLASAFTSQHVVISLAAGVPLSRLRRLIPSVRQWFRAMPNTAARIRQGVIGYCAGKEAAISIPLVETLFSPLGLVVQVEEGEPFESLAVGCSAGVGFVFELMEYWQEWLEEHGFEPALARQMTVKTFLGASQLADQSPASLSDLQARVVSKKGITSAGLNSMRELEIERLLRFSFEKSALRDRQIAEEQED